MKLKMAKNSLFAILLRSRWWISVVIGVLIGVVAMALLPAEMRVVGALSGAPFLVIGAMAARSQWRLPSEARVAQTVQAVQAMAWPAFAALLEQGFKQEGYTVTRSQHAAFDFELQREGRRTRVSARRWKAARIGMEGLRELQAARVLADELDETAAIHIGLGELSDNARSYATSHQISVWGAAEVALVLRSQPLSPGAQGG